jgi:transcriptional regulator with XRE-family HTH domain
MGEIRLMWELLWRIYSVSSNFEENLRERIREELARLNLTQADAARAIGDGSYLGLRDVCNGRKRATAEFVYSLSAAGADVLYILTGERSGSAALTPQESALLDNYRHCSPDAQAAVEAASLSWQKSKVKGKAA